jgi:hypothetical protein
MKDTVGWLLREAWKTKGGPDCLNRELSKERSFSGVTTGAYICTTMDHSLSVMSPGRTTETPLVMTVDRPDSRNGGN